MTGPDSSSPYTVTSSAAAGALVRASTRRFLEPFVGRELAPAEAAREIGVGVEEMAYRVRTLVTRGLVTATRQQPRAGRSVTFYRAPAEIRAPVALLERADTRALFDTVDAGGREAFLDALAAGADRSGLRDWVVRVHRAGPLVRLDLQPGSTGWDPDALLGNGAPAVLFHWAPLAVPADRAKELQRELDALLRRYVTTDGAETDRAETDGATTDGAPADGRASAPTHLLGLFLTPLPR